MTRVRPRARRHDDRAGDPLDGLVNLFDLGIVLSVAFLLAALSSLHLSGAITRHGLSAGLGPSVVVTPGQRVAPLPAPGKRVIGHGVQVGVVYRLTNGDLVYVQQSPTSTTPGSTVSPGSTTISPTTTTTTSTTSPTSTTSTTTPPGSTIP
jgi:hypothetical protein